jgi:hypothetical protein
VSEEAVRIQNITNQVQRVFSTDGRRLELQPNTVETLKSSIANIFLTERAKFVKVYKDTQIPDLPGEKVWIANFTGNPKAPEHLVVERYSKEHKRNMPTQTENPKREPVIIKQMMMGNQVNIGDQRYNSPPVKIQIPPYDRVLVPSSVAQWLEGRDGMAEPEFRGKVGRCRGPSNWEPNISWPLHEVMFYGSMIGGDDLPLDKKEFVEAKDGALEDAFAVKAELLKVLFFYLINEQIALPSETAFKAALERYEGSLEKKPSSGAKRLAESKN